MDDEPHIVKVLRKQLELSGFEVAVAADGASGLEQSRAWHPDLVVLDLMLPKLDGYAVCATLKQDADLGRIPVLMVTAKASQAEREEGLRRGADAYLTKPFGLDELMGMVERLLG